MILKSMYVTCYGLKKILYLLSDSFSFPTLTIPKKKAKFLFLQKL